LIRLGSLVPYPFIPPSKGGERAIYFLLKHLAAYVEIHCYTVAETSTGLESVKFYPVLGRSSNKLRYINPVLFFRLKKALKQQGIGVVMIEHPYYGWLGILLKKITGLKLVVRSHNIESLRFKTLGKWWWPVMKAYEKCVHRHADLNLFITPEDLNYAEKFFGLLTGRSMVATYGIERAAHPAIEERMQARSALCKTLGLPEDTILLFFNGSLGYAPNRNALDKILLRINPILKERLQLPYRILICGMGLPASYRDLTNYKKDHILYLGFVEDIDRYFLGTDIFLNPVTEGGGIKTKLVEALAAGTPSVSFATGAWGVPVSVTGESLAVVKDDDHNTFAEAVLRCTDYPAARIKTPQEFYDYFNWDRIAGRTIASIQSLI